MKQFYNELIKTIIKKKLSKEDLHKLKVNLCKKYKDVESHAREIYK